MSNCRNPLSLSLPRSRCPSLSLPNCLATYLSCNPLWKFIEIRQHRSAPASVAVLTLVNQIGQMWHACQKKHSVHTFLICWSQKAKIHAGSAVFWMSSDVKEDVFRSTSKIGLWQTWALQGVCMFKQDRSATMTALAPLSWAMRTWNRRALKSKPMQLIAFHIATNIASNIELRWTYYQARSSRCPLHLTMTWFTAACLGHKGTAASSDKQHFDRFLWGILDMFSKLSTRK